MVLFLLFLFVKAGEVAVGQDVVLYTRVCADGVLVKTGGFLTLAVHCDDLKRAGGGDSLHVGGKDLIGRVG